jgi:hypothetical protein
MRRRDFVKFVGGTAAVSTLPFFGAHGQQQPRKLATIGLLGSDTAAAHGRLFGPLARVGLE